MCSTDLASSLDLQHLIPNQDQIYSDSRSSAQIFTPADEIAFSQEMRESDARYQTDTCGTPNGPNEGISAPASSAVKDDETLSPERQTAAAYCATAPCGNTLANPIASGASGISPSEKLQTDAFLSAFDRARHCDGTERNGTEPSTPLATTTPQSVAPLPSPAQGVGPEQVSGLNGNKVSVSNAVLNSTGAGTQGAQSLSLGGGSNPHQDVSNKDGHQVLVAIDDAMDPAQIDIALESLNAWTEKAPGLEFVVKLDSELTSADKNQGGLFLEAVKSNAIDGNKGYASIGAKAGGFAHVRVATDTAQDEFLETWSHEIGHGLGLSHNLSTGSSPLADLSVMSDNDTDKSKDAPLPTAMDAAALASFGYGIAVNQASLAELNRLRA
jgi:hypothetical protein